MKWIQGGRKATIFVFLALLFFYSAVQFSTSRFIGNDGHYHVRYSHDILREGIPKTFPNLRFTVWNDSFRDHHFLFHVMTAPFTLISDMQIAGKLAVAVFAALAGLAFWWGLCRINARQKWLWLIFFVAGSSGFLFRMEMLRAQSLGAALLILLVIALMQRRWKLLFTVSFFNVWLYDSFPMILVIAAIWVVSCGMAQRRLDIKAFLLTLGGVVAGMLINPFFPKNIHSYYFNMKLALTQMGSHPFPAEWIPDSAWNILVANIPIVLVAIFLMSLSILLPKKDFNTDNDSEIRSEKLFLAFLSVMFVVMTFKARRFVEYSPAIVLLFLASVHRDLYPLAGKLRQRALTAAMVIVGVCGAVIISSDFVRNNQPDKEYSCYMHAGEWMNANVPKGEIVFTSDWDDFPRLYMNAPSVRFVVGLDPIYMIEYDKELYDFFSSVTRGEKKEPYIPIIRDKFESKYIFTDTRGEHQRFIDNIEADPNVYRLFSEEACYIYYIKPEK